MEEKIKLIIDTDNGTDIDDIIALYFALKYPGIEIVGIISSYLNTQLRVLQIKHVLKLFNREDIPVFAGAGIPLKGLHGCNLDYVYNQYTPDLGKQTSFNYDGDDAIDFLINKAKELKGDLHILEIAPETTLAKAILKDKNAFDKVKIHIMGGEFYKKSFEWNIECDYEAARIIAESDLDISYVGLDVCNCTEIKDQNLKNLFFNKNDDIKLDYLVNCVNAWQKTETRGIIIYDPITLLTIFDHKLCEFETKKINFRFENDHAYLVCENEGHLVKVAKTIDVKRLHEHILNLFKKEN